MANIFKDSSVFLISFFIFMSPNISYSQTELSGFFDAIGVANFLDTKESQFLINQFELDFSYSHKSHFSVGTAVAYNNKTENMELAMAFVHYSFDDGPGKHPRRVEGYNHSALLIGKFDMPFGLDYLSYASIDRPTITQPLVIEKTIAGWNDIGIDYHLFKNNLKFDLWAVNGFNEGVGIGGNVRYKFFQFLEIGVSHSADINNFKNVNDWLSGIDFMINTELFEIKSEFLWMKGVYEGAVDTVLNNKMHHGGYFQVLTKLERWTSLPLILTLRFGGWQCSGEIDDSIDDTQRRYSTTIGYNLHNNLALRMELVTNTYDNSTTETIVFLQMVVGF
jgi:hypothetical protein